ncbi:MAG: helix-turn-helix domain-containing protein [Candidatus Liptonbacteria bacterium]
MDLNKALRQSGLSTNEAAVYLALIHLGPSSVVSVAERAGLKRPNTYLVLDDLMRRGLVVRVPQERKKLFLAITPQKIEDDLRERVNDLARALPELLALYTSQTGRPSVKLFESTRGIIQAYYDIVQSPAQEIITFFSIDALPKEFQIAYKIFLDTFQKGNKRGREIVYTTNLNHPYLHGVKKIPRYQARITTATNKFFTDTIICGNKVALFSFRKKFALIIESEDISRSLTSLFELAWQSAKSI